jgi:FecR protein
MLRIFFPALLALACSVSGAMAAQQVGVAVEAATLVTGSGPEGDREIAKNSPIFQDDRLVATQSGNAQIILADKTRIVVGPGAQIEIDDFVYATSNTFATITVKASQGAFRFISGASKSAAYRIETPKGNIGVRGTAFDVGISGDQVHVVMVRGTVELCPTNGECQILRGLCSYGVMSDTNVAVAGNLRTRGQVEKANFPLMANERALRMQFRQGGGCASTASNIRTFGNQDRTGDTLSPEFSPSREQGGGRNNDGNGGNNNNR